MQVDGICAQLYVPVLTQGLKGQKELKGFGRLSLRANEKLNLNSRFGIQIYVSMTKSGLALEDCLYRFFIGFSSDDLPFSQAWRFDGVSWTRKLKDSIISKILAGNIEHEDS